MADAIKTVAQFYTDGNTYDADRAIGDVMTLAEGYVKLADGYPHDQDGRPIMFRQTYQHVHNLQSVTVISIEKRGAVWIVGVVGDDGDVWDCDPSNLTQE